MNLGHTIEWLALTAALVGLAAQAAYLLQGRPLLRRVALGSALAAAALAALAYAYLTWAFMTSRLDIEYVFSYTKATYPWYYKLAGTWGAQKGTMLLWAALTGACLAIFALARSPASGRGEPSAHEFERARQWTLLFLVALFASFLFLVVRQDTFAPTPDFLLVSRPDGNGLSPVLQAPLSLFHPPAEFIAYALTAVPAAAGLAFLATGTPAWSRVCRTWARVTWALYTVGIGLGAIWAYYTLSFGGYWAWDPVEVANLIPWIVLTAFLHTRVHNERHGSYAGLSPLLAIGGFWFSLFATLATRSGLWVSVHAFTDPTGTFARDPMLRLVNILHVEAQVAAIVGFMAALLFVSLALAALRFAPTSRVIRYGFGATCLAAAGAFAFAPVTATSVLWEALRIVSGGRTALAAGVFFLLVLLVPTLPLAAKLLRTSPADHPATPRALFSYQNLVYVAVLLLVTAFLATLILDSRGINGSDRKVFDQTAPLFVLPMVLILIPLFGSGLMEQRLLLAVTGGTLVVSVLSALAFRDAWVVAFATPMLVVALGLGLAQLTRSLSSTSHASSSASRFVVGLLLVGSIAGFVYWSHPPSLLRLPGFDITTGLVPRFVGTILAAAALALIPAYGRGGSRAAGLTAAALDIILIGHWIGLMAGAAALIILIAVPGRDEGRPLRAAFRRAHASFRPFAIHLIHVALLLGLLGYAWSTYAATEPADSFTMGVGDTARLGPYVLTYERTETVFDAPHDFTTLTTAFLRVEKDGQFMGYALVHMKWIDDVTHYDPDTRILRLPAGDVYVASLAMCRDPAVKCATNDDWIEAHEPGVQPLAKNEPVTAFAFRAKILPLVSLVWGSLFLFVLALGFLVHASLRPAAVSTRATVRRARVASRTLPPDDTEERLMQEVRGVGAAHREPVDVRKS